MQLIRETQRLNSPAPKPQALAWDGTSLWMGSRQTRELFEIDPASWTVRWQTTAPGTPYGMTVVGAELRVIIGDPVTDSRFIRRCVPRVGFDQNFGIPCPDDTGSQLGYDGRTLHVSQWYARKVLALDSTGQVTRVITIPHGICGQVFIGDLLYLVTTDAEETTDYWLTRVDVRQATPRVEDIAHIPFAARALMFDGTQFWTNHRDQNQIVSFARPD